MNPEKKLLFYVDKKDNPIVISKLHRKIFSGLKISAFLKRMAHPDGYVNEIESLNKEIKRLNAHLKSLREQRKTAQTHLYEYMVAHNLEKYNNITLKSVTPRQRKQRKPEKKKKEDAINLFRDIGVNDPEDFWLQFKATQSYTSPSKETKTDFDEMLGF